jgi:hypothetical protein
MTTHNTREGIEWYKKYKEQFGWSDNYWLDDPQIEFFHQELQKAREEEMERIKTTIETLLLDVQPLPEDADTFMGEYEQTVVKAGYMVKEWAMQAFEEPDQSELDQPTELFNTIKKDWDKQAEDLMNGDPTNITSE